ncbi:MAG: hypothetical protein P4M11_14985 [Candidatus Pacebacteria bacterium]|nr:hypothetical protein [Candidatus Paceibacterota bacterium]
MGEESRFARSGGGRAFALLFGEPVFCGGGGGGEARLYGDDFAETAYVGLEVRVQVPLLRETLVATGERAGEGALPRVFPHMDLECAGTHEAGLAGGATVRPT